uniref:BHLH domain-containing protein n=1 Tax=Trichuris muris TaxID=70415 RepID=A0A5S6QFG5_TRIMR
MGETANGSIGSGIPAIQFCTRENEAGGSPMLKEGGEPSSLWSYSSAFKPYGSLTVNTFAGRKEAEQKSSKPNPFSPECSVPLPFQLGDDYGFYAIDSLWKRNERERHRVRCVNEGYERLRNHLPLRNKSKRISKVETLRLAIRYIKYLQDLLAESDHGVAVPNFEDIAKGGS